MINKYNLPDKKTVSSVTVAGVKYVPEEGTNPKAMMEDEDPVVSLNIELQPQWEAPKTRLNIVRNIPAGEYVRLPGDECMYKVTSYRVQSESNVTVAGSGVILLLTVGRDGKELKDITSVRAIPSKTEVTHITNGKELFND